MSDDRKYSSDSVSVYGITEKNNIDISKKSSGKLSINKEKALSIDLNKNNIINGIILSELLGPPKSKRKRERLGRGRQSTVR